MLKKTQIEEFYNVLIYGQYHFPIKADTIKKCVNISYNTICRAFTKYSSFNAKKDKNNLIDYIVDGIISYPKGCNSFDEWHKNMCQSIESKYKLEIGYSQHIINLTLKYLCCLQVSNSGLNLTNIDFDDCHFDICMPNVRELKKNPFCYKSGLNSLTDIKTYNDYVEIQNKINTTMNRVSPKSTLIEFECSVWNK